MTQQRSLVLVIALVFSASVNALSCDDPDQCCVGKGSIQYCDSSAGRYVCGDGDYSSCYCTRHAIMDLQKVAGCCTWQGGVFKLDEYTHTVICNDGGISEVCSIYNPIKSVSLW